MSDKALEFFVPGLPAPQGSKRAFIVRPKHGQPRVALVEMAKDLKPWRAQVALTARQAMLAVNRLSWHKREALSVRLEFILPRPKSLAKRVIYPTGRPDLSKLIRGVEDALTGIVWVDDAQVTALVAYKNYSVHTPGVRVEVREREEP